MTFSLPSCEVRGGERHRLDSCATLGEAQRRGYLCGRLRAHSVYFAAFSCNSL
jgi:hypothetical protein